MKELILLGKMDHTTDNSYESRNRVYSRGGCIPTLVIHGNDQNGKVVRRVDENRNKAGNRQGIH